PPRGGGGGGERVGRGADRAPVRSRSRPTAVGPPAAYDRSIIGSSIAKSLTPLHGLCDSRTGPPLRPAPPPHRSTRGRPTCPRTAPPRSPRGGAPSTNSSAGHAGYAATWT